jgi:hypothetical protein
MVTRRPDRLFGGRGKTNPSFNTAPSPGPGNSSEVWTPSRTTQLSTQAWMPGPYRGPAEVHQRHFILGNPWVHRAEEGSSYFFSQHSTGRRNPTEQEALAHAATFCSRANLPKSDHHPVTRDDTNPSSGFSCHFLFLVNLYTATAVSHFVCWQGMRQFLLSGCHRLDEPNTTGRAVLVREPTTLSSMVFQSCHTAAGSPAHLSFGTST